MKWLIIQSDGEHKGQDGWEPNWQFRECYALQHALEHNGQQADIWGLRHNNYDRRPDFNGYEALLTCENYELDWLPDATRFRGLRFYWIIDAHWQPLGSYDSALLGYDIVLHSTRHCIQQYSHRYPTLKHLYFPNGVDERFFDQNLYPLRPHRKPLIFIGGKAAPRAEAIERMIAECGLEYSYGVTGMKYVEAVLDAQIQFNKGLNGDINYRNWETTGLGTCLLTEHDSEMENLGFEHAVNCLFYRSLDEAVQLARHYTSNGEWQRIGQEGYALSRRHTYTQRIKSMLDTI